MENSSVKFSSMVFLAAVVLTVGTSCSLFFEPKKDILDSGDIWVSAYLASWNHYVEGTTNGKTWGHLETNDIDWDAFTHLFYFNIYPDSGASLTPIIDYENVNPDRVRSIIQVAHQHSKPVLITIGGYNTRGNFLEAISAENRPQFIDNITGLINEWGFDGVDIDMQPLEAEDSDSIYTFITELSAAVKNISTPLLDEALLTVATVNQPNIYARFQDKVDQINIATYNMSRPFQGWVTWHNTPLYNGGNTFPIAGELPLPSIELRLNDYLNAGIERKKLGVAASFYGYEWEGVSEPLEEWEANNVPTVPWYGGTPYYALNEKYDLSNPLWDKEARVPYLSIEDPATFVSFDNGRSIEEKIDFIRREGIGGLLIWEISGGYLSEEPENNRDRLLQTVKTKLKEYGQ
ncbi:glycoside hydrolase family 18 protein [Gracilimonas amylolytica]|uniref:glycoside hydrolase family 18 protein n=1 Tax=Gracilimonas amylolytica TaxID=1749045 RepID=UPI00130012DE|nr:glycoside hydrolase family 18 protein [Gracilimonas amylolytica]